ncbi:MAG: MlaD family protein [Propionibacteriales bacterium]|nr:MlaD family protein [Propionibacteriales bacterium]
MAAARTRPGGLPSTGGAAARLLLFAVVSIVITATIAATIRPFGASNPRQTYQAVFASASRLAPGDDVRVAGVGVGKVTAVGVTSDATGVAAKVTFDVDDDLPLTSTTRLEIRYLDLAGNRYLALLDGATPGSVQPARQVIARDRTQPALDLDDLLDGFKPLLVALSPADVNSLTLDIVRTLQGDGATVQNLIARTASLTTGLARRDELIGSVVSNLNVAVGSVADRHGQLEELISQLRVLVGGLAKDRTSVTAAIGHIDTMTGLTADLLRAARPSTKADIAALRKVAGTLASPLGKAEIDHALDHLPDKLARLAATASYGSWFNYYVCGMRVTLGAGFPGLDAWINEQLSQIHVVDTAGRCAP